MRLRLSTFAVALVVAVNALVLAGVAWNRSGEPTAVLELTERELAMPYSGWSGRESTGVSLSIRRADQDYGWLDRGKLEELGFAVGRYEGRPRYEWRAVERQLFVVLEFDGPAFEALRAEQLTRVEETREGPESGETNRRQLEAAEAALERLETSESRLVAVDAGNEAASLRQRYPDRQRFAVIRALVRMQATSRPGQESEPVVRGWIGQLLPGRVHVPRRFHAPLRRSTDEVRNAYDAPPRYRVDVRLGRRAEPWVTGIEPIPAGANSETVAD